MTNYGIPRNETPKTLRQFKNMTLPTREQLDAQKIVEFITEQSPETRLHRSKFLKSERRFAADWVRKDIDPITRVNKYDNRRFGWEPRPTGWPKEEVPPYPAWLLHAIRPPWWSLVWARIRYGRRTTVNQTFKDWNRDEETWERRHPGRNFRDQIGYGL